MGAASRSHRLGRVPRARNADRLNGVSAADLLVRCPEWHHSGLRRLCRNKAPRTGARTAQLHIACEEVGDAPLRPDAGLPNHDELLTAVGNPGFTIAPAGELTREVFPSSTPGRVDVLYVTDDVGSVALTPNTAAGAKPFRCVTDPLN